VAGRWGAQYPSLWVTRGGGGTFNNIWSPDTYAQSGFYVSDTTTPGHVFEVSVEHHLFSKICHVHYPALSQIVQEACRDFGVKYTAHKSLFSAVASHFRWLVLMGRPIFTETSRGAA
jgi:hypothetical protein